jgi:hypothetical protein
MVNCLATPPGSCTVPKCMQEEAMVRPVCTVIDCARRARGGWEGRAWRRREAVLM